MVMERKCHVFELARPWIALWLAGLFAAPCAVTVAEETASTMANQAAHPLLPIIRYATSHAVYIRENVRDFSCRIIKRERIDGKLQEQQFANLHVRCEQRHDDGSVQPLAVFMQFVAPRTISDRRVLYIADQNDGKVLVRKGGKLMKHMKLKVDPLSARARSESKYLIMDAGLDKLMDRFIQQAEDDMERDPAAANTRVSHFGNALINDRPCTHIQIVHPQQGGGMEFHITSLYVDNELHVPTRLVVHGWPEREGDQPPVNEEYTYLNLRLNVGLTDSDFSETLLENSRSAQAATAVQLMR